MTSMAVLAYCPYVSVFSWVFNEPDTAPFIGEMQAAALCAGVLAVELAVLLWWRRRHPSVAGRWLLSLVAVTGLAAVGIALAANWYAAQSYVCQYLDKATVATELDYLVVVLTAVLLVTGVVRLVRGSRTR
jgi:hypothetical protein